MASWPPPRKPCPSSAGPARAWTRRWTAWRPPRPGSSATWTSCAGGRDWSGSSSSAPARKACSWRCRPTRRSRRTGRVGVACKRSSATRPLSSSSTRSKWQKRRRWSPRRFVPCWPSCVRRRSRSRVRHASWGATWPRPTRCCPWQTWPPSVTGSDPRSTRVTRS